MKNLLKITSVVALIFCVMNTANAESFGVKNLNDSGEGSLRQAVLNAKSGDVIDFFVTGTIVLKSTISIDKNISIFAHENEEVKVSGGGAIQPFNISGNVTIQNLHIINGKAENGGAIAASGKLILDNCTLTMNTANEGGALFIAESGWVLLKHCTVSKNPSAVTDAGFVKNLGTIEFDMPLDCKPGQKGHIDTN